jgi:alpha-galactosidase
MIAAQRLPARVEATCNRAAAIRGADYVIVTIQVGDLDAYAHDVEIPARYGVGQCVGDTLGPNGVFRGLRTIPPRTATHGCGCGAPWPWGTLIPGAPLIWA